MNSRREVNAASWIGMAILAMALQGAAMAGPSPTKEAPPPPDAADAPPATQPTIVEVSVPPLKVPTATAPAAKVPGALTVAILDFDARDPGNPQLGQQIGEILTASLSAEPDFQLVDRPSLTRVLQEQELNLTGAIDTDKAVKIGKLVGAKVLVTGRVFIIPPRLFMTAKLIGTETSLVEGVLVRGSSVSEADDLVMRLVDEISKRMRDKGSQLVAPPDEMDVVDLIKAKLADRKKPTVAVIIPERHMNLAQRAPDPAVETEIKLVLRQCGFAIKDVAQNDLADWARQMTRNDPGAWPRDLADVDYVIVGEAFSEPLARVGNLVSCGARAEINVIRRADGRIQLVDRETTRDADLSEQLAGKKALQKAGRKLAVRMLEDFAKTLPADKP